MGTYDNDKVKVVWGDYENVMTVAELRDEADQMDDESLDKLEVYDVETDERIYDILALLFD